MIEFYNKKEKEEKVEKINEFATGCWVHSVNPSKEEINFLINKLKILETSITDGLDIHENPRFEIDDKKAYIYLTSPTEKITQEPDSSFLIVYAKDFFLTLAKSNLEIFDRILSPKTNFSKFTKARNLVKILFLISRMYEESIHKILKEAKSDRKDLSKLKNHDIEKLINYEEKLNAYISSFGATIKVYSRILRDKSVKFLKTDEEKIEDLIIDLNETLDLCKQTSKMISNTRDYYSTKLSNDLNKTVSLLTLATIFISIPTLITSFYGMNIELPFQKDPNILLIVGGLSIGIYLFLILLLKKLKII